MRKKIISLVLHNEDFETIKEIQTNMNLYSLNEIYRTLFYSTETINSLYLKSLEYKKENEKIKIDVI